MDKEEILAKSREENRDRDFVEAEVLNHANSIALSVSLTICAIVSTLHAIFRNSVDYAVWIVQFTRVSPWTAVWRIQRVLFRALPAP